MKVTLTIETDSPVLHLVTKANDKVTMNVATENKVSLTKLNDNSIIFKQDVS